ncbi:MAG: glycosyltransferase family 1 protein [Vicinamibacterales bacterium]
MQILLDYRPALRQRTGVGGYMHEVAQALVATAPRDERLLLFSSSWKDRLDSQAVPGAEVLDRRVPVRVLNWAWHRLGWPPIESLTGRRVDVVQSAHPLLLPSRSAARVAMIHDLDFLDHPERTTAEIRRDYPRLAARHARAADQIVVVSRHTADDVASRFGIPASHISVCVPGAPSWPRRQTDPARGGCLLFIGTLEPRKNLETLLAAYARLLADSPDAPPLVLAGRIAAGAQPIVDLARQAPFAGRVELPGYVTEDAKRALFERALALVMPSHTEGFGLPALEAMVLGVPVIAARSGALPETTGGAALLVDASDEHALSHALRSVLADPNLRLRMRTAGWQHAAQFTWASTAQQIRGAWQLAVAHRTSARG